jgi:hypothetical protein
VLRENVLMGILLVALSSTVALSQTSRMTYGLQMAYGVENNIPPNPSNSHVKMLYAQPQIGWIVWDSPGARLPIKRFEVLSEGIVGAGVHPGGHLLGDTLMFRFDGNTARRYFPFFNFSSGPLHTTLNEKASELGGHVQFLSQGGVGLQRRRSGHGDLVVEYRYFHMSNASLATPNHGFNGSLVSIGMRWTRSPH